ncbi:hypothetical protein Bca4012_097356 [Brassica carinata]
MELLLCLISLSCESKTFPLRRKLFSISKPFLRNQKQISTENKLSNIVFFFNNKSD